MPGGHDYQWREIRVWWAPWSKRRVLRCTRCGRGASFKKVRRVGSDSY